MDDLARRPGPLDWVLAGVAAATAVVEGVLRPDVVWRPLELAVAVGLAATLPWRRLHPLAMVAVAFGTVSAVEVARLAAGVHAQPLGATAFLLLLPYALARWGTTRDLSLGVPVLVAAAALGIPASGRTAGDAAGGFAVLGVAVAAGAAMRFRAGARERELEHVRLREREQLARDLHDTVAHHVSAIAVRAQAGLAVAATEPSAATDALRVIEAEAGRTLAEMRAIVRELRDGEHAALTPARQVTDLTRLADDGGRPPVAVALSGPVGEVGAPVASAVYRLVQESVTNARRHARNATRIDVAVVAEADAVHVSVRDDGEPVGRPRASGYGIVGMRERARWLGGTCEAGPAPGGGWAVDAVLPRSTTA